MLKPVTKSIGSIFNVVHHSASALDELALTGRNVARNNRKTIQENSNFKRQKAQLKHEVKLDKFQDQMAKKQAAKKRAKAASARKQARNANANK